MSDLWFNIRFGTRHFQWGPRGMAWRHNDAHARQNRQTGWRWFQVYQWFGEGL